MRSKFALCTAALMMAGSLLNGSAATPAAGTLTPGGTVTWEGSFPGGLPLTPVADVRCLEGACDTFRLTVALGDTYWDLNDGAVEVAVRWAYDGVMDIDLIVRDAAGNELARSAAVDSNAESVFIDELPDGAYDVIVIPANTVNPDRDEPRPLPYEGLAQVEPARAVTGDPTDLLPNLVATPPANFHISTAAGLVPFPENPLLSCYAEETAENQRHPTRCLRFDQTIANTGDGPLELRFDLNGAASPDPEQQRLLQRVYRSDGSFTERLADSYELHAAHAHVHYKGFGQSFLWGYEWGSGRTGGGIPASVGDKVGFCVIDVLLLDAYWGATGNGPRTWTFPACNAPSEQNDEGTWLVQGIDVGWADVYGWNLPDQYIDITGIPDGVYEIEQLANPNGSVVEQTTADNSASTIICIRGDVVTEVGTQGEADACEGASIT